MAHRGQQKNRHGAVRCAAASVTAVLCSFVCRLGRLATEVGWKYGELVKKLEVPILSP